VKSSIQGSHFPSFVSLVSFVLAYFNNYLVQSRLLYLCFYLKDQKQSALDLPPEEFSRGTSNYRNYGSLELPFNNLDPCFSYNALHIVLHNPGISYYVAYIASDRVLFSSWNILYNCSGVRIRYHLRRLHIYELIVSF
jgi:hypothetical protein